MGVICVDLGALTTARAREFLNLMEPVKLTVWKFMIERVTVVKFRMNDGGGNGAGCFEVKVWADTAKFTDVIVTRCRSAVIWSEKVRCSSKMKPRLQAEWVVVREQTCILESCCLSPIRRNSVLEELRSVVEHYVSD